MDWTNDDWIDCELTEPEHTGIYITTCRIHEDVEGEHWVEMLRWQEEDGVYFWQDLNWKDPRAGRKRTVIAWMQKPKPYFKEVA